MARVTDAQIRRAAAKAGIPYRLFYAMVGQESGGRTGAVSSAGARGPAQLMPGTARRLEQTYGINTKTAYGNLLGGAYYLAEQKKRFGNWRLALAAYNAGPGAVEEAGNRIPDIEETQRYVRNILAKAGVLTGTEAGKGSGVQAPSSPGALPPPVAPSFTENDAMLEGVRDLMEGDYNPTRSLQGLLKVREAAEAASKATAAQRGSQSLPGPSTPQVSARDGITFNGQPATHDTDGLPGYPARDIFAAPGTPFLAPEDGRIIRLSGKGGTSGNVYGRSVYFKGRSGRIYFITHLVSPAGIGRYKAGQQIGAVSPWEDGAPHAHVGIKEPRRKR